MQQQERGNTSRLWLLIVKSEAEVAEEMFKVVETLHTAWLRRLKLLQSGTDSQPQPHTTKACRAFKKS